MSTWVFILVVAIVLFWNSIVFPRTAQYYAVTRWGGQRTGRILREQIGLIIPLIESGIWVSQELDEIPFEIEFVSKDKLVITCKGGIHHRPDHRINKVEGTVTETLPDGSTKEVIREKIVGPNQGGKNIFVGVSDEVFQVGIVKAATALISEIGGKVNSEDFIEQRDYVVGVVNAILRTKTPPHMNHDNTKCGVAGCKLPKEIPPDQVLGFAQTHWHLIQTSLGSEKEQPQDFSRIETLYGIDVERVVLNVVAFSPKTADALERQKRAEFQAGAFGKKIDLVKRAHAEAGISPDHALDDVSATMGDATKEVVSVQGGGRPVIVKGLNLGGKEV